MGRRSVVLMRWGRAPGDTHARNIATSPHRAGGPGPDANGRRPVRLRLSVVRHLWRQERLPSLLLHELSAMHGHPERHRRHLHTQPLLSRRRARGPARRAPPALRLRGPHPRHQVRARLLRGAVAAAAARARLNVEGAEFAPRSPGGGAALRDRLAIGHLLIFSDRPADAWRAVLRIHGDREALIAKRGDDLAELAQLRRCVAEGAAATVDRTGP